MTSVNNKLVFITGAGRGIGREAAIALSQEGYFVAGCSRNLSELEETRRLAAANSERFQIASVDVTDERAMAHWFEFMPRSFKDARPEPWGLLTCAGTYGVIGDFVDSSWDEWKKAIDVNLLGSVLAVKLFSRFQRKARRQGRIVMMSGGGATKPIANFSSYCVAKSGLVRFAETVALELKDSGISINCIAPGAINTKFLQDVLDAGAEKAGAMYQVALKQKESGGADPAKAVALISYLLKENTGRITGRLLAALWDEWPSMHDWFEKIENTDVYTLRRITLEDRGL